MSFWLNVLVQTPAHSALGSILTYRSGTDFVPGTLVRVPLGSREMLGVVWSRDSDQATGEFDPARVKEVGSVLEGIAPLSPHWQQLISFTAQYYQRSAGEVALAALPPQLRELSAE